MSTRIDIKSSGGGGSTPVGATLMRTGSLTSYRTGDDADTRNEGRATDFFTLATNNPFGHNQRFTDELGGSTYTNNIVIDWSTYDNIGGTVLGYYRSIMPTTNWNSQIDACLALSVGTFTTGWRLWNVNEMNNVLIGEYSNNGMEYSPFNFIRVQCWTSSTNATGTTQAIYSNQFLRIQNVALKTASLYGVAVRTFTVSGTTLS